MYQRQKIKKQVKGLISYPNGTEGTKRAKGLIGGTMSGMGRLRLSKKGASIKGRK